MDAIVDFIHNTATPLLVCVYFMWRDSKFMGELQTTLQTLVDTVDALQVSIGKEKE